MTVEEKLVKIAENTPKVYEAGKAEGIAEGKQAEYDAFWDNFQNKGAARRYDYAFAGQVWTEKIFRPKYNLIPTNAQYMFAYGALSGLDLTAHLEKLGVTLDTSRSTSFDHMFYYGSPYRVPAISTVGANALQSIFQYCSVSTVDKLILRDDGSQTFKNPFTGTKFGKLIVEGVIGNNGFNIQDSTGLTHDSIVSIVTALSTTTTGLTVTFSKTAVDKAFETVEGENDGSTSAEWLALVATRSNWTIALA